MAGKIVADTLEHSTAGSLDTQYVVDGSAKAWARTSGNGDVVEDNLNMASITDNSTGDKTIGLVSNMGSTLYAVVATVRVGSGNTFVAQMQESNAGSIRIDTKGDADDEADRDFSVVAFGDLA